MYHLFVLLILLSGKNSASSPALLPASTLDPKQLTALHSMGLSIGVDPCNNPATTCDNSSPFRHLISLRLSNCSSNHNNLHLHLHLTSFHQLISLSFSRCCPFHFPAILSHLPNLTHLSITDLIPSSSSLLFIIFSHMHNLRSATISNATLKGPIPGSISLLQSLHFLDLSSNSLSGLLPAAIGDLIFLKALSFARNSLSGPIPETMAAIPELAQLDLSYNRFNGTIPGFLSEMRSLRRLNLESNDFRGVLPFNASFIERLELFRVGGNGNLCYNRSLLSSKLALGIAPCDKYGFPVPPPLGKGDVDNSFSDYDYGGDEDDKGGGGGGGQHGVNRLVLGVAIALSCLFFLVIFLVCLSKFWGK